MSKKIVIVGGGPGGYVAAIRAAQLGAEVHLVEKESLGGTCLNVGCIPTKALLHTAELFQAVKNGERIGIKGESVEIDWPALMNRKQSVVRRLVGGVNGLLKANKVNVHKGKAEFVDHRTIRVTGTAVETISADAIVLAAGSAPAKIPFQGSDLPGVIDSSGALSLPSLPESILIVGGGYIGVEFAALFSAFGSKVTIIELLPEILPGIDSELAKGIRQKLEKSGVAILNNAKLSAVQKTAGGLQSQIAVGGETKDIITETVLVAVGRRPVIEGLELEKAGIKTHHGKISVDGNYETNIAGIFAIGDCNGLTMLAHAASHQGIAAVEHILGHKTKHIKPIVPSCIYTTPEIASVGLTEEKLKEQGIAYKKGVFPLAGNGKAMIEEGEAGFVKILADEKYGEILGVHMIGPRVTEMIGEATLAMRLEATVEELITTIHAHPTVSESLGEAALAVSGQAIHWPPGMIMN